MLSSDSSFQDITQNLRIHKPACERVMTSSSLTRELNKHNKMIPLIMCEISLCQYVCELVLGVDVLDLDLGVQKNSIEQPIKRNSVGS